MCIGTVIYTVPAGDLPLYAPDIVNPPYLNWTSGDFSIPPRTVRSCNLTISLGFAQQVTVTAESKPDACLSVTVSLPLSLFPFPHLPSFTPFAYIRCQFVAQGRSDIESSILFIFIEIRPVRSSQTFTPAH